MDRFETGGPVVRRANVHAEDAETDFDQSSDRRGVFDDQYVLFHTSVIGRTSVYFTVSWRGRSWKLVPDIQWTGPESSRASVLFSARRSNRGDTVLSPYRTEPYSDFNEPTTADKYRAAIDTVAAQLGERALLVIGGEHIDTSASISSVNPAAPDQIVGTSASADRDDVDRAIEAAWSAFGSWSRRTAEERAGVIHRVGDLIAERTFEFAAWQTFEAGKNWAEAEADVAEAIDFCRYYAHQALRLAEPVEVSTYPGELNESWLQPIGAGVVIPPWNFPLAILVGMAVGPVAAGNTVVLKPASNTPLVGWGFMKVLEEAGLPPGVINYLPGSGSEIGDRLVDHPRTRFVNFTGSKEVGLRIAERSAIVHDGQRWLKRSYMEMGGKDALIVDDTCDLNAAAADAVRSAFGFQGQKCSACSRLIVFASVHDELMDKVVDIAAGLRLGKPVENHPIGPVISAAQHASILREITLGIDEADLVMGGRPVDRDGGYYIEPTIFDGVDPTSRLAQHEIFGPVLSVIAVADFDEALDVANGTEFGLTGGVYSSDVQRLERAKREFHAGNLYLNRKITGALVGIQPFGGFNMSGSNAKAGGPDYLRLFMEMKSVARRL
ncbi:MAG: L-glutamate gamma-semialdehyde dehydrogenase [Proteobacteria bacterium]|nr:L-glutamate gamma-semialdehyde dehydrogenase [Pseudomonadota bacterium]